MAYTIAPRNENVRRVALELTHQHGLSSTHATDIGDGFTVPTWLLFVSEAQTLWLKHIAVNGLKWDGTK